ncbi:MAG TPA: dipeptidase [Bryobacteraceae bacterium]|nr:dipeptidase [Bryobacteraceae bacterium]
MRILEICRDNSRELRSHGTHDYRLGVCLWALAAACPLHGQPAVSQRARTLHASALVFDGHVHAVDREFYHGGDIGERKTTGQFDLPRAREGGLGALFFSIFVSEDYYPARYETKEALRMLDCAVEQIGRNRQTIEIARTASDIERIHAGGRIAAVLDIEGSFDLDGDTAVLRDMYRLGMRSVQLSAHNWTSNYADSCCSPPQWHGLNDHGRAYVREMNRLGMVINVSHASDEAISQAVDISTDPVIATHHGLRAVNDIPRNMPDWLVKKIAAKGGVIGFQLGNDFHNRKAFDWRTQHAGKPFWDTSSVLARGTNLSMAELDRLVGRQFPMLPDELPEDIRMTVDEWVAVVDHAIQLAGEDHVSLGSDFDGGPPLPRGMRDVRDLPMITDAMLRRGYSQERIRKFLGANLLRVFRQITEKSR